MNRNKIFYKIICVAIIEKKIPKIRKTYEVLFNNQ